MITSVARIGSFDKSVPIIPVHWLCAEYCDKHVRCSQERLLPEQCLNIRRIAWGWLMIGSITGTNTARTHRHDGLPPNGNTLQGCNS
jgi:hypothetical protein